MTPEQAAALEAARQLAAAGMPLFLAIPDPSAPTGFRLPSGWQHSTPDPTVVDTWRPGMALAAVCGLGLDVVDVDPRNGGTDAQLAGVLPTAYATAATPSDGVHYFVRSMGVRKGRPHGTTGIDVQAGAPDGQGRGFVFIAPTVRVSKTTGQPTAYRWTQPPDPHRLAGRAGDLSGARLAALMTAPPAPAQPTVEGFMRVGPLDMVQAGQLEQLVDREGGRDNAVAKIAAALRGRGGWRLEDALAYMRASVWPELDQSRGGHEYTLDQLEATVTAQWRQYQDGSEQRAAEQAPVTDPDGRYLELRSRLLDAAGLRNLPRPEPLVDGWLYRNTLAWLVGTPGHGKTFVGCDLACSIATGTPWHDHPVKPGRVVYVIAEGASGLSQRIDAWSIMHGLPVNEVLFLPVAVQLFSGGDVAPFCRLITELAPALVVIDTQARTSVGADENSARDMGLLVASLERLRAASGACVLVVHHSPRGGDNPRGSTALEGAADTIMRAEKDGSLVKVRNTKQKDSPEAQAFTVRLAESGSSAALTRNLGSAASIMTASEQQLLSTLHKLGGEAASTTLMQAADLPRSTFYDCTASLFDRGLLLKVVEGRSTRWRVPDFTPVMSETPVGHYTSEPVQSEESGVVREVEPPSDLGKSGQSESSPGGQSVRPESDDSIGVGPPSDQPSDTQISNAGIRVEGAA